MSLKGPIILIEDDANDLDVIAAALKENKFLNEPRSFTQAKDALEYLINTAEQPFIILCDIRMAGMNGLDLRSLINQNEYLRKKSIPFVFFTALVSQDIINEAYELGVQGFFEKPAGYELLKKQLHSIVSYWSNCLHPNSDDTPI